MPERLQGRAVTLSARQQPLCALGIDAILDLDLRVHLDACRADRNIAISPHRAAEVPMNTDVDVHRLELDTHVRGDRSKRALLADGQGRGKDVAGARRVSGPTRGGMKSSADGYRGKFVWGNRAMPGVG